MTATLIMPPRTSVPDAIATPRCPRCGGEDVQLLSSQAMYTPALSEKSDLAMLMISTHKCQCGICFTETATLREKK
jgi:hypothetical protein